MCKKATRRYLEFDEDIAGTIEDVEMPMQAFKEKTPPTEKATRIAKKKMLKGDKITRYMSKSPVEEGACKTTKSLARSQPMATRDKAASTSELDTPAKMSDSGSEAAAPRECLRRKAMANRATAETKCNDEDSIVIKMSEWKAMTEIITEVFREIQCIGSRLYLMSKKDTDIKKRRDAISKKAIKLHSTLDEMRLKRNARIVTATMMTTPPGRSEEKEGKRKEMSPVEGKGSVEEKETNDSGGLIRRSLCRQQLGKSDYGMHGQRCKGRQDPYPRKERKRNGQPDGGQEGERIGQAKEAGGTEDDT